MNHIEFVKSILPDHYQVEEGVKENSIRCRSRVGLSERVDADDEEHWSYVLAAIKNHFGNLFQEIFHVTCSRHQHFIIYYNDKETDRAV